MAGRMSAHSSSSGARFSVGAREDALHRAINDPKFFPALEGLANAVIGQDLNSVCSKEELEEYRNELLRLGEEMVAIRQEAAKTKTAAQQVEEMHRGAVLADVPEAKALEEEIKTAQGNVQNAAPSNDRRPDNMLRQVLSNEEDDVAVVGSGGLQTKCPMTQQVMVRPLLNKKCKHYYSPEGFQMLQRNRQLRCPICKRMFSATDVEPDEEMGARIAQYVRDQEYQESQRMTQMTEDATLID